MTFSFIWISSFTDNYLEPLPKDPEERHAIEVANVWRGIWSIVVFMLAFSYLKPYPEYGLSAMQQRINRLVVTGTLIYMCGLIFMLNLRPEQGRNFLGNLDDTLNKSVTKEMHTYDDNCELEWDNIMDNFDHYYIVHLCNWFLASFVIRDVYILHFWQLLDEVVELSVQHILPHFRECWWDHIFCDILLSNIPAITAGIFCVRYFGVREYDWLGREGKNSVWEWDIFTCHKKFGAVNYQQFLLLLHFLAGFFVNNALLIPPKHDIVKIRLLLWFGFGAVAHREAYIDTQSWGTMKRKEEPVEGRYRWLTVGILSSEMLLSYKYREGTGNL